MIMSSFLLLQVPRLVDTEPGAAVVMTIESTQISALSSGSLVSKGKFTGNVTQKTHCTVKPV